MKNDNPQDHKHSDYNHGILGIIWLTVGFNFLLLAAMCTSECRQEKRTDATNDRIDQIECRDAADEAACLRDLLEDK